MGSWSWTPLAIYESPYAVVLLNQPIKLATFNQVWNGAEFRISVDGASNRLSELQKDMTTGHLENPNLITGDFDSIKEAVTKSYEAQGVKIVHTPDQDFTDFTKALFELQNGITRNEFPKVDRVLTIVESSGRLDHIFGNLKTLFTPQLTLPVFILGKDSLSWLFRSGKHRIQVDQSYIKENNPVGIIPLCGPTHLVSTGLHWNLNDTYRFDGGGMISTSNKISDETVEIVTEKDVLWTMKTPRNQT